MADTFVKLCQEHPLLTYIEDCFIDSDIEGYKYLKSGLYEANLPHVQIGMKQIFQDSKLAKVQNLTSFKDLTEEEIAAAAKDAEEEKNRPPSQLAQGAPGKAGKVEPPSKPTTGFKGPNSEKFTPHCISLRTGPLATMSDLFDFIRYSASLDANRRFQLIIDDKACEEVDPEMKSSVIDLGLGLGCEYIYIKGIAKPERLAKVYHYASYF